MDATRRTTIRSSLWLGVLLASALAGPGCGASRRAGSTLSLRTPRTFVHRRALVIGNGAYRDVSPLDNATNDARLIARSLERVGFETDIVEDADLESFRAAVRAFTRRVDRGDLALVYYAGHGVSVGGQNYLLPVDFLLEYGDSLGSHVDEYAFSVQSLLAQLESRSSLNVVVFDACRNNPWVERALRAAMRDVAGPARSVTRGLSTVQLEDTDTLVFFATAEGEVASDGDGRNGPLATSIAEHVAEPISVHDLFAIVTGDVRGRTNGHQRPYTAGSVSSIVQLAAPDATIEPPPVATSQQAPTIQNAAPVVSAPTPQPEVSVAAEVPDPNAAALRRAWGYGILAGGLVGLGLGVGSNLYRESQVQIYGAHNLCATPSYRCDDYNSAVDTAEKLMWVGYVAGGVLSLTGAILLLTAPSSAPQNTARLECGLNPTSLTFGCRGQF